MTNQQKQAAKSYAKVFLATVLSAFLASGKGGDVFAVSLGDVRTWIAAGVAAVVPLIITWLDPEDPRFGRGA